MFSRLSIRSQLILTVLVLAVSMMAWQAIETRQQFRLAQEQAVREAGNLTATLAGTVGQFLGDVHFVLAEAAGLPEVQAMDSAVCSEPLAALRPYLRYQRNIFVVDAQGMVRCSGMGRPVGGPPGYSDREWFQRVSESGRPYVGGPLVGRASGQWVAVVAHPVLGPDGEFKGVVSSTVDLERFQAFLVDAELPGTTLVTLAHEGRTVLARSQGGTELLGDTLPTAVPDLNLFEPGGGSLRTVDSDGVDRVFAWRAIPGSRWVLFVGISEESLMAGPMAAVRRAFLGEVLMLALLLSMVAWTYRGVLRSLSALVRGTQAAADGDPSQVPTSGPREVVEVGRQFQRTLEARLAAEAEVRAAELRWRSILENSAFGVFLTDDAGRLVEVNPALGDLLEESDPGRLQGRVFRDLFWDSERGNEQQNNLFRGESIRGSEERFTTTQGNLRTVRLTGRRVIPPSGVPRLEVFVEDISAQQDLKIQFLQSQKMEAVGRLAGGVAHDFNNLLTVIQGHSEILLGSLADGSQGRRNANEILQAAERASNLTGQLLAFSRQGGPEPVQSADVNSVVRGMERMSRRLIGRHITMDLDLNPVPHARIDPTRLEQIIMNLVVNARDAMPEGGTLTLRTRESPGTPDREGPTGNWTVLEVADTGTGMEPEVQGRIFDPFFTTKPPGLGSGLGLSTVYGIVNGLGGTIQTESAPGRGATFVIHLPVEEAAPEEDGAPMDLPSPPEAGEDSGVVLVVEDDGQVREIMERVLAHAGYTTLLARDGQEGLEILQERGDEVDLVVSDVVMPRLKGTEMVDQIRPLYPTLPVVFVSGYAQGHIDQAYLEARGATLLTKPFRAADLLDHVRSALAGDSVGDALAQD